EPEHAALNALQELGLADTFRLFEQEAGVYSWWDYRMNNFKRNRGLRIDLILASPELTRSCTDTRVDMEPRRRERPSDHAPAVAKFSV
ncbi:MAG: exodeoxyribonuclease III, partial [Spiribacter salinus]